MFGIDEIYEELLLEAKSPEEIRKILMYQFVDGKGVPVDVFNNIFNSDPTRKKTYTKWALIQWGNVNERENILKAVLDNKIGHMFEYFQKRANDGLNLLSINSFSEALSMVPQKDNDPIFGDKDKGGRENNYEIVYDSQDWRIAVPNTVDASVKLGKGSRWCTAGYYGNAASYYNDYTRRGKLYVNFDKRRSEVSKVNGIEYPYKRYQFCFEASVAGELQDLNNERIDYYEMEIPNDVMDFYGEIDESYVEKLDGSNDESKVIERYNQIRLQNCVVTKEGPNDTKLMLLPEFDEDLVYNDDCNYCVYTSSDITDPLDWANYTPDEDIISTCGDIPMLIMANRGGYSGDEINVYYIDSHPVRNDLGYWAVLDDVSVYGVYDEIAYAFEGDRLFMAFPNSVERAVIKQLPFRDATYENINIDGMPSEYSHGKHWIKISYDNNFYGLFYIDSELKDIKLIVKSDKPINDEFEVIEENGKYIIKCKIRDYILFSDENLTDDKNAKYEALETIGYGDKYYIVSYFDEDAPSLKSYGIFSVNDKKLIVGNALHIEEFGEFVLIKYKKYNVIYDYENNEEVSSRFLQHRYICNSHALAYLPLHSPNKVEIFSCFTDSLIGEFDTVGSEVGPYCIMVSNSGPQTANKLLNIQTGTIVVGGSDISNVDSLGYSFLTFVKNGANCVYDIVNDEILTEYNSSTPIELYDGAGQRYKYRMANGKFNLFTTGNGAIIPGGADSILRFEGMYSSCIIPFKNNNKWLFMYRKAYNYRVLPSKNGIDCSIVKDIFIKGDTHSPELTFKITIDGLDYNITYFPETNYIFKVNDRKIYEIEDEIREKIEKIFYPDKAQISEHFNNLLDRMNNL